MTFSVGTMPGNSLAKDLLDLIYRQRVQDNEFFLRLATRTSFLTITGATGSHVAIREVDRLLAKWFLAGSRKTATVRIAAYLLMIYGGPGWCGLEPPTSPLSGAFKVLYA
jgi:hypothetical protein